MTFIAEVRLSHPDLALAETIEAVPEATVTVSYPTVGESDESWLLFVVEGDDLEAFDAALAEDPTVDDRLVIVSDETHRIYRVRLLTNLLLSAVTAELGIHVLEVQSSNGDWLLKLQANERETLVTFREYCAQKGVQFETDSLYTHDEAVSIYAFDTLELTDKQREALVAAYESGYFSTPRQTTLRELGETLGVSSTAISKRLRAGMAKLVEALVAPT